MTLTERFAALAREMENRRIGPEDFMAEVDKEPGEEIEWLAQTYSNGMMINVFRLVSPGAADAWCAISTGDGGYLFGYQGPAASLDALMDDIGPAEEGWTYL
jgi:hypothetical protein